MKAVYSKWCVSNNNKSYTFLRNYKALQKESKQKQKDKQTNKQTNTQTKSKR